MCGIAGIISKDVSRINENILVRMGSCLAHRGPDGKGTWTNNDRTAGFSHTRLTVIDTSETAAQPMHYDGRYTIIYNGEIYNYIELRAGLAGAGYKFRTVSDTEVILAAYAHYREECVRHFDGMFSFAIWDDVDKVLFCARDRFGEKPFYYAQNDGLYFASEIKALLAAGINDATDDGMLLQFLGTGRTIDPANSSRTFYSSIKKLPAAHWMKFDYESSSGEIKKYWDVSKQVVNIPLNEALEMLDSLLTVSVRRRLRSDVSLGTSLSGGLDSSGIAATLFSCNVSNLKTFTASFPGFEKDESANAALVAKNFGLTNHTVEPGAKDLADTMGRLAYYHDEPVATASVYAQFKVFELAAWQNVTVLLDGQGADEVFAGYDHYRKWRLRTILPGYTALLLEKRERKNLTALPFLNVDFLSVAIEQVDVTKPVVRELNDLLYFDTFCYGLEQLLRYADRNSMAHGREVRLPYLYHELVSFVFSLPAAYKIHEGYTKWVLRKLMDDKIPDEIVWKKRKTGFEPPQRKWMENSRMIEYLREAKSHLVQYGLLDKLVLDQRPSSNEAFDRQAYEWRWMAISAFIRNKKGV
ncbi:MAG: asparagine synthase (glutamine-hydrolyzing) [Chitinophagaceae bacterium]|nr:asparagine synthase (glutamine-hydrolyzing) [Chitinophagaceae bacterium]